MTGKLIRFNVAVLLHHRDLYLCNWNKYRPSPKRKHAKPESLAIILAVSEKLPWMLIVNVHDASVHVISKYEITRRNVTVVK